MSRDRAEQYRRLARECLEMARTISFGTKREILIDMAQTWLRLAEEQEVAIPPIKAEKAQPVMQQQQQVQPKDDNME